MATRATVVVALVAALALGLTAACTSSDEREGAPPMTETDELRRVVWDVSEPVTTDELGDAIDGASVVETLGRNGIDATVTLPGGDTVSGQFRLVLGNAGPDGRIEFVYLGSDNGDDASTSARIDEFVNRWGGDRAAMDAYLTQARAAVAAGEVEPGRYFDGERQPGYNPVLRLSVGESGTIVQIELSLDYGSTG